METTRKRMIGTGIIDIGLALVLTVGSVSWSLLAPVSGGIACWAVAGMFLGLALIAGRPAPALAAPVVAIGAATGLAQWWFHPEVTGGVVWAAVLSGAATYAFIAGLILPRANREHEAPVTDLGGSGEAGRALIVYHSIGGRFQPAIERALAEGLQTQGWQVQMTTASQVTPTDVSTYQLLVLGAPAVAQHPARPVVDYLKRVGDLRGKPVALVVSAGGMGGPALRSLHNQVAAAHGRVVADIEVWTDRDNVPRHGLSDPEAILRREGARLKVA